VSVDVSGEVVEMFVFERDGLDVAGVLSVVGK